MGYTKEDVLRIAKEKDVKFIRLQFTDIFGQLKNVAITASQLEKALDNECMFDGSSIEGFVRINESDMYLRPDYDSFVILPWKDRVARLICDVYCADGNTPFLGDPRNVLKKVVKEAADMGYTFNVGPECEFFLFQLDEDGNPTTKQAMLRVTLIWAPPIRVSSAEETSALRSRAWALKSRLRTTRLPRASTR